MKLYMAWPSGYSQKAILAFYEKGIDVELEQVKLFDPAEKAKYLEIYPIGKVPLLKDGDWTVPESSIIVEYLENHYPDKGTRLIPDDPHESRQVRFMDRMNDLYMQNQIGTIFFDSRKPEAQRNPEAVAQAKRILDHCYEQLNNMLAEREWLFGDQFTLADISAFAPLFYGKMVYPYNNYPNLVAYQERLMKRPSVEKLMKDVMPAVQAMMSG